MSHFGVAYAAVVLLGYDRWQTATLKTKRQDLLLLLAATHLLIQAAVLLAAAVLLLAAGAVPL